MLPKLFDFTVCLTEEIWKNSFASFFFFFYYGAVMFQKLHKERTLITVL